VDDAFQHPAKFSRALIRRIYQHALEEGWIAPGSTIVDPFGGVALGSLDAMWNGCHWIGCELEERFVTLGRMNIERFTRRYGNKEGWGSAMLLQGDSRQLANVIQQAALVVSSPPYVSGGHHTDVFGGWNKNGGGQRWRTNKDEAGYGVTEGQLGTLKEGDLDLVLSSPPYVDGGRGYGTDPHPERALGMKHSSAAAESANNFRHGYGHAPGQLGALKEGAFDAVLTSPPYADRCSNDNQRTIHAEGLRKGHNERDGATYGSTNGQLGTLKEGAFDAVLTSPPYEGSVHNGNGIDPEKLTGNRPGKNTQAKNEGYGVTAGNLGNAPKGDFDAVVSSPPYEGIRQDGGGFKKEGRGAFGAYTEEPVDLWHTLRDQNNLGNLKTGDTFWLAARTILEQCHLLLKPGGVAIFVCKDFVRDKQRVPFSDQWLQLCEAVGFRLVCRHMALLVESYGEQGGLFGESTKVERSKKSFFRRLAEKNGSPRIDHEDVLCVRKSYQEDLFG
jgi:tRNA G10  N-methylase Trm11